MAAPVGRDHGFQHTHGEYSSSNVGNGGLTISKGLYISKTESSFSACHGTVNGMHGGDHSFFLNTFSCFSL